jgi:pimeloyl-ACP methyl ester carboxylesterase
VARRLVFLPGVSGSGDFWAPVAELLTDQVAEQTTAFVDWPGLGVVPARAGVDSWADLGQLVVDAMSGPSVLIAQSMGGVVAVDVARRVPTEVEALVLCATSGGIDVAAFGARDWRAEVRTASPSTPAWVLEPVEDRSAAIERLDLPVLLIWASHDATSPVAVGESLQARFPNAQLVVIDSDDHWVARSQAPLVAGAIDRFLGRLGSVADHTQPGGADR